MVQGPTPESRSDGDDAGRVESPPTGDGPAPDREGEGRTDEGALDPMAPGRSIVDPDVGDAVEPNEPA